MKEISTVLLTQKQSLENNFWLQLTKMDFSFSSVQSIFHFDREDDFKKIHRAWDQEIIQGFSRHLQKPVNDWGLEEWQAINRLTFYGLKLPLLGLIYLLLEQKRTPTAVLLEQFKKCFERDKKDCLEKVMWSPLSLNKLHFLQEVLDQNLHIKDTQEEIQCSIPFLKPWFADLSRESSALDWLKVNVQAWEAFFLQDPLKQSIILEHLLNHFQKIKPMPEQWLCSVVVIHQMGFGKMTFLSPLLSSLEKAFFSQWVSWLEGPAQEKLLLDRWSALDCWSDWFQNTPYSASPGMMELKQMLDPSHQWILVADSERQASLWGQYQSLVREHWIQQKCLGVDMIQNDAKKKRL